MTHETPRATRGRHAEALTPREREVIDLLSSGLTNEAIARRLGISLDGVKYHVSGIFRRLRVENRYEAAALHLGTDGSVLTPREQEVIELVSAGLSNEEIARRLGISLEGVKYHVSQILRRLGAENRHEAVTLRLRGESKGRLAALAPVALMRRLPFGWLAKGAAAGAVTAAAAGIALFAWSVCGSPLVPQHRRGAAWPGVPLLHSAARRANRRRRPARMRSAPSARTAPARAR